MKLQAVVMGLNLTKDGITRESVPEAYAALLLDGNYMEIRLCLCVPTRLKLRGKVVMPGNKDAGKSIPRETLHIL
jgi:hypothetical protein